MNESTDPNYFPVPTLEEARLAASVCRECPLWQNATQTVFGEGPATARVMMVGEQPGNDEDLAGKPFVGPAGRILDKALNEAGINRHEVYVTNTVKHFKWEPKGARRIHKKPNMQEIMACSPWLNMELEIIRPEVLICLGATAAQALIEPGFKVTEARGKLIPSPLARVVIATVHPSSILRLPEPEAGNEMKKFVEDLKVIAGHINNLQ